MRATVNGTRMWAQHRYNYRSTLIAVDGIRMYLGGNRIVITHNTVVIVVHNTIIVVHNTALAHDIRRWGLASNQNRSGD